MSVAPNSYIDTFGSPRDKFMENRNATHYNIFFRQKKESKMEFRCVLAIKVQDEVKPYDFFFVATKID
jgi:hypothetical protein